MSGVFVMTAWHYKPPEEQYHNIQYDIFTLFYSKSAIWCQLLAICDILIWQYMKISILKYTPDPIYYNVKPAKLAPNALKTAKKCELPNSKLGTVSIKILKNHKMYHRKSENI